MWEKSPDFWADRAPRTGFRSRRVAPAAVPAHGYELVFAGVCRVEYNRFVDNFSVQPGRTTVTLSAGETFFLCSVPRRFDDVANDDAES